MSFNLDGAFEIDEGIVIQKNNEQVVGIFAGPDSPVGSQAPIGSRFRQTNGLIWDKYGNGAGEWRIVSVYQKFQTSVTLTGDDITKVTFLRPGNSKIAEVDINYSNDNVTSEVWKFYDSDGTSLLRTQTRSYTYNGDDISSESVAIS